MYLHFHNLFFFENRIVADSVGNELEIEINNESEINTNECDKNNKDSSSQERLDDGYVIVSNPNKLKECESMSDINSVSTNNNDLDGLNYDPFDTSGDPELSDNEYNPYGEFAINHRKSECIRTGIPYVPPKSNYPTYSSNDENEIETVSGIKCIIGDNSNISISNSPYSIQNSLYSSHNNQLSINTITSSHVSTKCTTSTNNANHKTNGLSTSSISFSTSPNNLHIQSTSYTSSSSSSSTSTTTSYK